MNTNLITGVDAKILQNHSFVLFEPVRPPKSFLHNTSSFIIHQILPFRKNFCLFLGDLEYIWACLVELVNFGRFLPGKRDF